jgi:hypothetical protein
MLQRGSNRCSSGWLRRGSNCRLGLDCWLGAVAIILAALVHIGRTWAKAPMVEGKERKPVEMHPFLDQNLLIGELGWSIVGINKEKFILN